MPLGVDRGASVGALDAASAAPDTSDAAATYSAIFPRDMVALRQASISVTVFVVLLERSPQLLIGTPKACCTVSPTRVYGSPGRLICRPVLNRPPALPTVMSGTFSSECVRASPWSVCHNTSERSRI